MALETVGHVEPSAHAPARPLEAGGEIEHLGVRRVKRNVEKGEETLGEPGDIVNRAAVERVERVDAGEREEVGEAGAGANFRARAPGHFGVRRPRVGHGPVRSPSRADPHLIALRFKLAILAGRSFGRANGPA